MVQESLDFVVEFDPGATSSQAVQQSTNGESGSNVKPTADKAVLRAVAEVGAAVAEGSERSTNSIAAIRKAVEANAGENRLI